MKKFIAILLVLSIMIFSGNVSCYAENNKHKNISSSTVSNNVKLHTYTEDEKKQLEEVFRSTLLELSKDKKFMDSLIKNYKDTSNKPSHFFSFHNIKKLSLSSIKWTIRKIVVFFIKVFGVCVGIPVTGLILFHFAEKVMKNIPGSDLFFKLLLKFSPELVGDGKSGKK